MATSSRASQAGSRQPPPPPGLPVWDTALAAFSDVLANTDKLTTLAIPWLLLSTAAGILAMAHPALAEAGWNVAQAIAGFGALAIGAAWVRWRQRGEEPRGMAPFDRSALCVALRSLVHPLLVLVVVGCVFVPWLPFSSTGDGSLEPLGPAIAASLLAGSLAYLATFPLFYLYALLGALRSEAPGIGEVLAASRGFRGRLWLVYAVFTLLSTLIPLAGLGIALGVIGPVDDSLGGAAASATAALLEGLLTILGQVVSYGMAAASGALAAIVWSRLARARPAGQPPA